MQAVRNKDIKVTTVTGRVVTGVVSLASVGIFGGLMFAAMLGM